MKTSESIKNIAAALNRAQKNIGGAVKGSANPFFKSKYAGLPEVMEACKDALNAEGISVLQPVNSDEHGDYVETVLLHESGEYISSSMRLAATKNMQELGSATSYARRYGLQSMVFIPAEDDDGESSLGRGKNESKPASNNVTTITKAAPAAAASTYVKPPAPVPTADSLAKTTAAPAAKAEEKKTPSFKPAAPKAATNGGDSW